MPSIYTFKQSSKGIVGSFEELTETTSSRGEKEYLGFGLLRVERVDRALSFDDRGRAVKSFELVKGHS